MKRSLRAALAALLAVGMMTAATVPAVAVERAAAPPRAAAVDDATASIAGWVGIELVDGGSVIPLSSGRMIAWKLDDAGELYDFVGEVLITGGAVRLEGLTGGTYALQFVADDSDTYGSEYYADARYFSDRVDLVLNPGQELQLNDVVLEARYFDVARLSGADRYSTAVAITQATFPDGFAAPVIYLASGENFPDALAAGPAAMVQGGGVLLTRASVLPPAIAAELARLKPARIVVAGGKGAISDAVMRQVRAAVGASTTITRIGGGTRYETGELLIRDAFGTHGAEQVLVATGRDYPDALAAGPAGARVGAPVILVDGKVGLTAQTRALITDLGATQSMVIGGTGAVGENLERGLRAFTDVERLGGLSRFDTATVVNARYFDTADHGVLATGMGFADALAGGPLAAALGGPMVLSQKSCIPMSSATILLDKQVAGILLLGGTGALDTRVEQLYVC